MINIHDYEATSNFFSSHMYDRLRSMESNKSIFNFLRRVDNGICNETLAMQILIYELAGQNAVFEKNLMDLAERLPWNK